MTRMTAVLLSYFGPAVPGILLLLFFAAFDSEPPVALMLTALVLTLIAALYIRVYFAMWYARAKGRSSALGLLSLFGLLGWISLIVTEDRSTVIPVEPSSRPVPSAPLKEASQ